MVSKWELSIAFTYFTVSRVMRVWNLAQHTLGGKQGDTLTQMHTYGSSGACKPPGMWEETPPDYRETRTGILLCVKFISVSCTTVFPD